MPGEPAIGAQLDDYRLEELIGRGGMGVVYRATDTVLDRSVALKLIAPELAGDERFRERFLRESRLAASIEHPNILPVHAAGEADGAFWIAMRYVDGSDLRTVIEREGALEPDRVLALLAPIADALDAAHERGLVHRDVKPANVLTDSRGRAYLSDFGLTKQVTSISGLTATGQIVGTLEYLAPEQIRGDPLDGRADQYALACVLYECLAGKPPFVRESEAQLLWAHMHEQPPQLADARLDAAVRRGLAKEPGQRYPSCSDLIAEAQAALGLEVVPRRRLRRRWLLAIAAAVGLAAVAAVAALLAGGGGTPAPIVVAPNSVVKIDPKTGRISDAVRVGRDPFALRVAGGAVWTTSEIDGTLWRIDPGTGKTLVLGGLTAPADIARAGGQNIWVGSTARGEVTLVDGKALNVADRLPTPGEDASDVAVGGGSLWVIDGSSVVGTASRVDPATGKILKQVPFARGTPAVIDYANGAAWVSDFFLGQLVRIDAETGAVRRIQVGDSAIGVAAGFGSIWVACRLDNEVWRINAVSGDVQAIVKVAKNPVGVAAGEGGIWVTSEGVPTVSRIDPRTNQVTTEIGVPKFPGPIDVGAGGVWVGISKTAAGGPLA